MENFSALPKADIKSTTPSRQRHAVFHYFLSEDSKQDSATITTHINSFISLIKDKTLLTTSMSTIWGNTYYSTEQYRCASVL